MVQSKLKELRSNKDVEDELTKERDKGFLRWNKVNNKLEKGRGPLILSRVGAVVTFKNGKKKVRLIHDLRRSRVNPMVRVPERTILPRIEDAAFSMVGVALVALTEQRAKALESAAKTV